MEQIFTNERRVCGGETPNVGKLIITPCHQGYGTTLGNALRRVLLSSLPGAAVEAIKINGAQHEFSTLEGVLEDVIEIILNVKQIAVISHTDQPVAIMVKKSGVGSVLAADFSKNSDIEIVNPDLVIANITDKNITFEMELTIGRGRGYVPVADKETKQLTLGTIAIDSLYTPIRDVGYAVEMTRVGDVTDYEKLTMTIETNGTVMPRSAVEQATKILMDHFALILGAGEGLQNTNEEGSVETMVQDEETAIEPTDASEEKSSPKKAKSAKNGGKKAKKTE